ncbi:hypothetical protein SAMN04488128_103669 [Chitinophaga eiseniae]|uniref:DUF6268 domain-containing protein n=1 Tax=Chitinophaga eiseniae TaxID=634771 RepID=A0A1T4SWD5_9BACT|nr:DUF6268 family outer membrane beta-barrel protein [Chitinophaga eiseniae]SKA32456.1 hypothetical protein SAMN04488128_103669 [Chitinophaga eiseniae]
MAHLLSCLQSRLTKKPAYHKPAYWLLPGLLLLSGAVKAQLGASSLTGPGIAINADYQPSSHYIRPEDSLKMPATSAQRRFSMGAGFLLSQKIDTVTGKTRIWNLGVMGSYTRFSNKDYEEDIFPKELFGGEIALQHMRSLNPKWSLMGILSVGLYTDMEKITYEDVFITGGVIFVRKINRKLNLGVGAALTNSFGAPMVLPALLVQWRTGNRFRVDINFPEKLSVSSSLSKYDDLALAFRFNGGAYDVENRKDGKRLMGYQEMSLGLENTLHLSKKIDFNLAGGTVLLRSVTFRDKKISDIFSTRPEHRLATNLYISAGIRCRF